ncbi:hypothetical protein A2483_00785 [Candidatus Peregrinibacteria bacterium RIFOXYC2_FULL_33_13]|nr:MAG: hypothetical protein UR27_C0004G0045 [Candidatus Peregrinibacteria bacterium GW2011_GWA2_33_10]KKP41154.1 MAG: hypothetical protein UR30_C0001G0001 [Candidatus Peregrinibacteria bacterium GW2011_GWC2_33_13]OGJ50379.1 MAG: hypothetical protein A2229_00155 [Candidatus Peregrinibacteria bacterium RIFOXYA2_FULL_33_7]OGJ52139.1 MAG: hypothetical protein A2483_00785 [Candidatus Peregrinibacteria bacterium RIFOXYC2_FULL_33_13]
MTEEFNDLTQTEEFKELEPVEIGGNSGRQLYEVPEQSSNRLNQPPLYDSITNENLVGMHSPVFGRVECRCNGCPDKLGECRLQIKEALKNITPGIFGKILQRYLGFGHNHADIISFFEAKRICATKGFSENKDND